MREPRPGFIGRPSLLEHAAGHNSLLRLEQGVELSRSISPLGFKRAAEPCACLA